MCICDYMCTYFLPKPTRSFPSGVSKGACTKPACRHQSLGVPLLFLFVPMYRCRIALFSSTVFIAAFLSINLAGCKEEKWYIQRNKKIKIKLANQKYYIWQSCPSKIMTNLRLLHINKSWEFITNRRVL